MLGFSRCHLVVLYSWHMSVPSVSRRQCSVKPDGNAWASPVHCASAIDDQPSRTIIASTSLDAILSLCIASLHHLRVSQTPSGLPSPRSESGGADPVAPKRTDSSERTVDSSIAMEHGQVEKE